MIQKTHQIRLREHMPASQGWGHSQGRKLYQELLACVEANPGIKIFRISLDGVDRFDASFPRESIMELAKRYRGDKGFCFVDVVDPDLIDNLESGAIKKNQPMINWTGESATIIGPPPSPGTVKIFNFVLSQESVKAADAVKSLDIKLNNASTKLKQLWEKGYVMRREEAAATGGVEYIYYRVK